MPHGGLVPLVILATAATVIASQAVITGAFSLAHQASQLGYLLASTCSTPPSANTGRSTSRSSIGFDGSRAGAGARLPELCKLAFAYGMAVTGTLAITTILFFVIVRRGWRRPLWLALLGAGLFLSVELAFFGANLTKFLHGAWVPLLIGVILFIVMTTWFRGRELVTAERFEVEGPLQAFVDDIRTMDPPVNRTPGTAVFMNRGKETAPLSMRACVDHLHALQEHVVILSLENLPTPRISPADRLEVDDLRYQDDGITFVRAKHGYAEHYDVPALVRQIADAGVECPVDARDASFYLQGGADARDRPGMSRWRKRLFLVTALISAEPADYFQLPRGGPSRSARRSSSEALPAGRREAAASRPGTAGQARCRPPCGPSQNAPRLPPRPWRDPSEPEGRHVDVALQSQNPRICGAFQ